jgi:F-box protein 9
MEEPNLELETFRQKWKEEVSAKSRNEGNKVSDAGSSKTSRRPLAAPRLSTDKAVKLAEDEEEDYTISHSMPLGDGLNESSNIEEGESSNTKSGSREPRSALEHYEKAVEKETQGSLGDSLDLYRKAFKVQSVHIN